MNIVRVEKNKDYTVINNTSLYDDRLSWKAKAIHVFMLSKPDNWTFHNSEMMRWAKDKENSFASGLKELKEYGYVKKERRRNENGKFDWITVVYEVPQEIQEILENQVAEPVQPSPDSPYMENPPMVEPYPEKPYVENPRMEKPLVEKPSVENQGLISTNIPSTDLLSTEELSTDFKKIEEEVEDKAPPAQAPAASKPPQQENAFTFYQANGFGALSGYSMGKIDAWCEDVGDALVIHAMKLAIENNAVKWAYVESILRGWTQKQIRTVEQAEAESLRFTAERSKQQASYQQNRTRRPYGKTEKLPEWFDNQQPSAQPPLEQPRTAPINVTGNVVENIEVDVTAEYEKLIRQLRGPIQQTEMRGEGHV